jgi:hypothetical protein
MNQNTTCERCFSAVIRGILREICQPCRRAVVWMMGSALVQDLCRPELPTFSSPEDSRESIVPEIISDDGEDHWPDHGIEMQEVYASSA